MKTWSRQEEKAFETPVFENFKQAKKIVEDHENREIAHNFMQKKRAAIEFFTEAWETAADFYRQEILGITPDPDQKDSDMIGEALTKIKRDDSVEDYRKYQAIDAAKFLEEEDIFDIEQEAVADKVRSNSIFVKLLKEKNEINKLEILKLLILADEPVSEYREKATRRAIKITKEILNEGENEEKRLELFKNALGQTKKVDRDKSPERESKDNDLSPLKFYHKDQPHYELSNFYYNEQSKSTAGITGEAKYPISCHIPNELNEKGEAVEEKELFGRINQIFNFQSPSEIREFADEIKFQTRGD
ncbi:22568_t:CDS:2 [Entrophospora sp. SA101]|nr:348_t:CDS:2 [Entrophospora sp. SA101]CAJ0748215.1 22568_t:CDS:2 [Entrophospora sp. SA101]CAJ0844611.1 4037_t:CDS:2 [Entrophospora sp. SA101]CAJ0881196.1 20774_t:CDS:2 [Entrophospora sp. SA101]